VRHRPSRGSCPALAGKPANNTPSPIPLAILGISDLPRCGIASPGDAVRLAPGDAARLVPGDAVRLVPGDAVRLHRELNGCLIPSLIERVGGSPAEMRLAVPPGTTLY
jgi:hypothetical protein